MQFGPMRGGKDAPKWASLRAGVEVVEVGELFVLNIPIECDALDGGVCSIYEDRPRPCRDFPTAPADLIAIPECGYRFVKE
tara:strand:- start:771 stop:1013 length:243 start_codon:yes stop_codon:yes gene_type:complete